MDIECDYLSGIMDRDHYHPQYCTLCEIINLYEGVSRCECHVGKVKYCLYLSMPKWGGWKEDWEYGHNRHSRH